MKINWRRVWFKFNKWYEIEDYRSWLKQKNQIVRLVEAELKPKRKKVKK